MSLKRDAAVAPSYGTDGPREGGGKKVRVHRHTKLPVMTPLPKDAHYWQQHPTVEMDGEHSPGGMFHTRGRMRPTDEKEPKRWLMLFLLSYGSAMNQALCFSYAPFAKIAGLRYEPGVVEISAVIFFATYIPMSFVGSYVTDRYGLRTALLAASAMQVLGAWLRWASCYSATHETYVLYLGQFVCSLGMCVFVNTPPRLSTSWFPSTERTLATNISVNANSLGAAFAYFLAPLLVTTIDDFPTYNCVLAALCTVGFVLASNLFESHPDWHTPDVVLEYDWRQWIDVWSKEGFASTIIVFAVSECVLNTMATLLAKLVRPNGFTRQEADLLGAEFLVVCMAGGVLFGSFQHKWHLHKNLGKVMVLCGVAMLFLRCVLASERGAEGWAVCLAIFMTGVTLGPLQATCNELGVECAFPVSENTIAAMQQLVGNLASAIFIPVMSQLHSERAETTGPVGVVGHIMSLKQWWAMPEVVIALMLFASSTVLFNYTGSYRRLTMEREMKEKRLEWEAEHGTFDLPTAFA